MDNPIKENISERLLEQYEELFIQKNADIVQKLRLGFIEEDCSIPVISIVINCMENLEIFNDTQLNNISNLINRMTYA